MASAPARRIEPPEVERGPDAAQVPRRRLERRPHAPPECDILLYDPELDVPSSKTHRIAVHDLSSLLEPLASTLGLEFLSDQSIWYLDDKTGEQRTFYGDLVLSRATESATADDLACVIEVVSTNDARKERKDTVRQRRLNEANRVPEFGLYFPDLEDPRSFELFRFDGASGEYVSIPAMNGRVRSSSVPGLEFQLLPRSEWRDGRKLDVYFDGQRCLRKDEEHALRQQERARAEQEKARAEQEKARAEQEKARAEQEKFRAEQEKFRAEQEKFRAEQEKARADRVEQDKARAEQEKARVEHEKLHAEREKLHAEARAEQEKARAAEASARAERLAERLRALGVDPDEEAAECDTD
ncbi:MAG: Uma2 family endonuclease [Deltaproteobacteria bacterium]|nr:Uma2 family endonuclease [Deltaproteobacteria bacterium]